MRCLVVDDEQLVRELLESTIRQIPFLELVKSCKNALEAAATLQAEPIDLIFLDIQMPQLSGLEFLQSLSKPPLVILVTAYEQYALDGYTFQVVDYILKPFRFERFLKACNRANELFLLQQSALSSPAEKPSDFFVPVEYSQVKIVTSDIKYIEGLGDYIKIYLTTANKPILTRMSIKAIEQKLPASSFARIHKSYLIALQKVTAIKRDTICIGEKELPIGETYKENIGRIFRG
ncbi:LytR/AlgR family response regulator transcription factor [Dyadobacter luticola]|nr:LytTR family DNA-binding domain-containing protein [Dyadobacter luticola]